MSKSLINMIDENCNKKIKNENEMKMLKIK